MTADELAELAQIIRREYGEQLPPSTRNETALDRQLREEQTRLVLDREVMRDVAARRRAERQPTMSEADETAIVDQIVAGMFAIPKLLGPLRDPTVTDILVFGSAPTRIERVDGSIEFGEPLVANDHDLNEVIYQVALDRNRPFNYEHHVVDLELEPGVRFHGSGFDVVQRPYITIRRATMMQASMEDLYQRGAASHGAIDLLAAAVRAKMSILFVGAMGSGKTTWLRAVIGAIPEHHVITTIESDFELNVLNNDHHPWVVAYQERLPTTVNGRGYTTAQAMAPAMRTRADWIVVGEVRGAEGAALVRAMQTGQGAMGTVHGTNTEKGLANLVNLIAADTGGARSDLTAQVYAAVDLVVVVDGSNAEGRWISEIVAPAVESSDRLVLHEIYGDAGHRDDPRAYALHPPPGPMMQQLTRHTPLYDEQWREGVVLDDFKPLKRGRA